MKDHDIWQEIQQQYQDEKNGLDISNPLYNKKICPCCRKLVEKNEKWVMN